MKFSRIIIPKDKCEAKGICAIDIQRLSNVIAFVGKNGSGKTRILDLIEAHLFSDNVTLKNIANGTITCMQNPLTLAPNPEIKRLQDEIAQLIELQSGLENDLRHELKRLPMGSPICVRIKDSLSRVRATLTALEKQLSRTEPNLPLDASILASRCLKRIRKRDIQQLQVEIQEGQVITFEILMEKVAGSADNDGWKSIYTNAYKYLDGLTDRLYDDEKECKGNKKKFKEKESYKRYESLEKLVKKFLDKDLTWEDETKEITKEGRLRTLTLTTHWALNGRPFDYAEFSEGEKMLFSYALLFFILEQESNSDIGESIILIDEPELHLHPEVEIKLIDGIRGVIKDKGQLIIATHSVNILSTLNYDEIFMVERTAEESKITSPSRATPGKCLSELMGIEQGVQKMSDFLSDISAWAFVNFVVQCFSDPDVIANANPNDPQIKALIEALKKIKVNSGNKTALLDFGAGEGRVYRGIKSENDLFNNIDYHALEPNKDFHPTLKELDASKIYTHHAELTEASVFDFVLLCNVLHEIPLEEWKKSLNAIIHSLKSDGHLIIAEAKYLSKGEKIGKIGHLLLDREEIKILFNLPSLPILITVPGKEDANMTCVAIQKSDLETISSENIKRAIEALEKNTLGKIENIREEDERSPRKVDDSGRRYDIGRKTAFLSQQHINAKIALNHIMLRVALLNTLMARCIRKGLGERVKKIVVEHLGVSAEQVSPEAVFSDDLGADALDTVEIIMAIEEVFGVEIPDEEAEKLTSVGKVIAFLIAKGFDK